MGPARRPPAAKSRPHNDLCRFPVAQHPETPEEPEKLRSQTVSLDLLLTSTDIPRSGRPKHRKSLLKKSRFDLGNPVSSCFFILSVSLSAFSASSAVRPFCVFCGGISRYP